MAAKGNYEYGTSPRKIETKRAKGKTKKEKEKEKAKLKEKEAKQKRKEKIEKGRRARLITYMCLGFTILFAISYRNSQIDEHFNEVQKLKKELVALQKENERLRINIENSLNLNNIEKEAQELLGMQRLTNKQRVYIELPKEDYVESSTEEIIRHEENTFQKVVNNIKNILNNI